MARQYVAVLAFLFIIIVAPACGDDNEEAAPTSTAVVPTPESTATSVPETPVSTAGLTGIAELDAVIAAIQSGDGQAIRELMRLTTFACTTEGGLPPPPACPEGVPGGSPVERFPYTTCETTMLMEEDLGAEGPAGGQIYGAYEAGDAAFFEEEYLIIFAEDAVTGAGASAVGVKDGAIVAIRSSCPPLPATDYVASLGLGDPLQAPEQQ
jgi:hypothetical protein